MSNLFSSDDSGTVKAPKRIIIWLLPLTIIIIFAGVFLSLSWRKLMPSKEFDVARARVGKTVSLAKAGEVQFRGAGWIEADPFPIKITALVSGIVKKVHIIAGEKVSRGQLLVELINEDLLLEKTKASSVLDKLKLDLRKKYLEIKAQEVKLKEVKAHMESAKAMAARIKHKAGAYSLSGKAISRFDIEQANLEYQEKLKIVDEFDTRLQQVHAQIALIKNGVGIVNAKIRIQKVEIEKIELDLKRTQIHSPADGIIEYLFAREGRKQMLGSDNEDSTTVARIFNPEKIQVRVDVPLSDVGKVKIGQQAKIHIEFLNEPLSGEVTSIYGHADYQKNTLEVKVKIPGGHQALRPDMLAQVEFLSIVSKNTEKIEGVSGVFIKKEAIIENTRVWSVNAESQITLKKVKVGKIENDGWVEILEGINPGERIILSAPSDLKEGDSIKIGKIYE